LVTKKYFGNAEKHTIEPYCKAYNQAFPSKTTHPSKKMTIKAKISEATNSNTACKRNTKIVIN